MSWLKKVSQNQISNDPIDIIWGVIEDRYDGSGPSVTQPDGGGAYQRLRELTRMGSSPDICSTINEAAGINVAAGPKMRILAEAAGCPFEPASPQNSEQPQESNMIDPTMMPMVGQQEKPMNMPAIEFE